MARHLAQSRRIIVKTFITLFSLLAIQGPLTAEQVAIDYDIDPVGGGLGSKGAGQTFTPRDSVEGEVPDTLKLTEFKMFRGSGGTGESQVSDTVYLVIYDGDPDTANKVGASTNSLDIELDDSSGTEYTWSFDSLEFDSDTEYWAVMSNDPVDDNILQPGGTWIQMSLQTIGGTDYSGGVSIIANRNKHQTLVTDLRFKATFELEQISRPIVVEGVIVSAERETITLRWKSVAGKVYAIDRSGDLESPWDEIDDSVDSQGGETSHTFTNVSPELTRLFFQIREQPTAN